MSFMAAPSSPASRSSSTGAARPMKQRSTSSMRRTGSPIVPEVPARGATRRSRSLSDAVRTRPQQQQEQQETVVDDDDSIINSQKMLHQLTKQIDTIVREIADTEYDINEEMKYMNKLQHMKYSKQNQLTQANYMYGVGVVPGIGLASPLERIIKSIERNIQLSEHRLEAYEDRLESLQIELTYKQNRYNTELKKQRNSNNSNNNKLMMMSKE